MRRIKNAADPEGLVNPGVLLSDDPTIHLSNLKDLPAASPIVDACMECGFCEPKCPSRDLTLTPRQRIAVQRELARSPSRQLQSEFQYDGLDTCAVDGLCALACPVGIDTGALTKSLRGKGKPLARFAAGHFQLAEKALRAALPFGRLLRPDLPRPAMRHSHAKPDKVDAILFQTCVERALDTKAVDAFVEVCARAGIGVWAPEARGLCCGMPFDSKGFSHEGAKLRAQTLAAVSEWAQEGVPVVVGNSPCSLSLGSTVVDSAGFLAREVLPKLTIAARLEGAYVFSPCSLQKLGLQEDLRAIAEACLDSISGPLEPHCCGFAGDRGFTHPELTASALQGLESHPLCVSASRTCEIGLARASGGRAISVAELLLIASSSF